MDLFSELFDEELIFINLDCATKYEFFDEISCLLLNKGYVKEGFKEAIIKREEKYPTGLRTQPYHVAIPHTDPVNIITPFIAMIRPAKEIEFIEMATDDQKVHAKLIFVLGLKKSEKQAALLQKLIDMFMNEKVMNQLLSETEKPLILSILESNVA